jgi:predicted deacylase
MPGTVWRVGGTTVLPGTRVNTSVEVGSLGDGSAVTIPVILACGAENGPTVYIGAGVHGDEVTSTATATHAMLEIDPARLRGRVICVPVQSPLAFRAHHRLAMELLIRSPMDQFATDPFMHFPGDGDGNYGQRVARRLFDLMSTADAAFDLHTPTTGGRYVPFVFLPPPTVERGVYERCIAMARAFSPDFVLKADSGVYVGEGTGHVAAARAGIPAFGFEVGEGGHLEQDGVRRGVAGLVNGLRHLGLLEGEPEQLGPCRFVESMTAVRAARGGLWELEASLGVDVEEGECLGVVRDVLGEVVQEVRAPHAGPLMRITTFGAVGSTERLVQIGVEIR